MGVVSIKKAAIINFISKYSNVLLQLIINSILARLLTPSDYGIVSVIMVFISFFTIIADVGFGPAIIQDKELNKRQISDIFIFTAVIGIVVSISFAIFSYPISIFYNNKSYITIGSILAISIFFNILNIVPNAILLKEKRFIFLGIRTIIITVISGVITIILALNGAKYYALVFNSVLIAMLGFIINIIFLKFTIYFSFSMNSIKRVRAYASYQFGYNFINYFARNLDNLLIGKYIGKVALGYYDKSYQLMLYPVQNLTYVITPILHPILSEYQNNKDKIYYQYIKVVKFLSLIGVFVTIYCFWASEEIVLIMFGYQWKNSIECFRILSISIWFQLTVTSAGAIYQSISNTKLMFKSGIIHVCITILLILIGVSLKNIKVVATMVSISLIIKFFVDYYILINKGFRRSFIKFINIFKNELVIFLVMTISCNVLNNIKLNNIILSAFYKFIVSLILFVILINITKENKIFANLLGKGKKSEV